MPLVEIHWLCTRVGQLHGVEHPLPESGTKEEWIKDYTRAAIERVVEGSCDGKRIVESAYLMSERMRSELHSMAEASTEGRLQEFLLSVSMVNVSFVPAAVVVEVFLTIPPEQLRLWR